MNQPEEIRVTKVYSLRSEIGLNKRYAAQRPEVAYERAYLRYLQTCTLLNSQVSDRPISELKHLDIGCGDGRQLKELDILGFSPCNLFGIDIVSEHIAKAVSLSRSEYTFAQQDARKLSFESSYFDSITINTVFSSILDDQVRLDVAREVVRVLRPGGIVIIYDFIYNNPRNSDVKKVDSKFINNGFRGLSVTKKSLTIAPPISRKLSKFGYRFLSLFDVLFPIFRTHAIYILKK